MRQRSRSRSWTYLFLFLLLVVVGGVSYVAWRQSVSGVRVTATPPKLIGHKTAFPVTLEAQGGHVARAEVRLVQSGKATVVAKPDGPFGRRVEVPVTLEATPLGLKEGAATLEVWAQDDFWRPLRGGDRASASYPITIDLTPPKLDVLAATPYISPGGAGIVVFRAGDATRAEVRVGARTFPSTPLGPPDRGARVALFGLSHDWAPGTPMTVTAHDEAGNAASRGIPGELKPRKFPTDRIEIKDAFLQSKVPELLPQHPPGKPLIEAFLFINRDLRKQAEEEKLRIGAKSADTFLIEGAFVQPRNTKVFSNFAEARTYFYEGREVDRQTHFGYDLAATKQAPVPAANKGVVAFVGPLTIYGNTVILDHGLGLQTLYAHLSSIDVKAGDTVGKGHVLGRSGSTGLAVGDHLHYEVLVRGVSVTPLEWWDGKWIRDRINKPLKEAGLPEIAFVTADGGEEPARPARSARSGRGRSR